MEKQDLLLTIGKNLKKYREMNRLTQEQLAEKAEISYPFYTNLERGSKGLSVFTLKKISDVLGVSLDCLISEKPQDEVIQNISAFLREKPEESVKAVNYLIRMIFESKLL